MNPEDVARLYSGARAGFELVGYQEVGLPNWQLSLNCMVLTHKEIPPLAEFVLRAVDAELRTIEEISGFLGLDQKIVTASMVPLFQDGYIRTGAEDPNAFELTRAGVVLSRRCEMVTPEERVFPLDYDGFTRELVDWGNVVKHTRNDLNKFGITPLPAFPDTAPNADEITVPAVRSFVAETLNREQKGRVIRREVLSVEGLHDKRRVFFIRAVALLYKSPQSGEAQVGFAIDGRLSQPHEDAFARAAGLKKLGVLAALKESVSDVALLELDEETVAAIADRPEVTELARLAVTRKREVIELEEAAVASQGSEGASESTSEALSEARERLAKTEARLTQYPVRMLEVFEHPEILDEALREASERLLIVSPWIKNAVVKSAFLERLEAALRRDVDVTICYGINRYNPAEGSDGYPIRALTQLAEQYPNLVFSALGDTHAKVLILDHRYMVVTSFNWLSFRGDPSKPFRDERGVLVAIPAKIDVEYDKYMQRVSEVAECVEAEQEPPAGGTTDVT